MRTVENTYPIELLAGEHAGEVICVAVHCVHRVCSVCVTHGIAFKAAVVHPAKVLL